MDWKNVIQQEPNTYKVPERWLYIHYYEALNILFRFENTLRMFVYMVLKNKYFDDWCKQDIKCEDSNHGTIESIARKRITQSNKYGYLGYPISSPIMHLTGGELIGLIFSDAHWKYFAEYFPGGKEIMKNKLDEISSIRNALAHFRPIKKDDVEVIKQNVKQTLMHVEDNINEMMRSYDVVPTNLDEDWYKSMETLGCEHCTLRFYQSTSKRWIKLDLTYKSSILDKNVYSNDWINYKGLNLISPSILRKFGDLKKYVTFITEFPSNTQVNENHDVFVSKTLSFQFLRNVFEDNYKVLKKDIELLLSLIIEETDLVVQDNLARGSIIEPASYYASFQKREEMNYWSIDKDNFSCNVKKDDPAEYWGNFSFPNSDFVAGIEKYPWMPVNISDVEFPF